MHLFFFIIDKYKTSLKGAIQVQKMYKKGTHLKGEKYKQ